MKLNFNAKKVAGLGSVALLGMAMAGVASAETFNASATVQTTVAITNIVDMDLGTIYATTASGAAGETYSAMTLSPAGVMGAKVDGTAAGVVLIGLGGQAAATASIAVSGTSPVTLTLPSAEFTVVPGGAGYGAGISPLGVEVAAADPSVAKFLLGGFTVGDVTGGTADASCTNTTDQLYDCVLTPSFGSTQIDFGIGADIVTDVKSGNTAYQPTTYTGSFTVTASY